MGQLKMSPEAQKEKKEKKIIRGLKIMAYEKRTWVFLAGEAKPA